MINTFIEIRSRAQVESQRVKDFAAKVEDAKKHLQVNPPVRTGSWIGSRRIPLLHYSLGL
jgi:hypothetical protein